MEGLIIAAGKGSRLRDMGESKPLTPLLGIPLIEHIIVKASDSGIKSFTVVTGYKHQELESFLKDLSSRRNIPIKTLFNEYWQQENGLSVLAAKKQFKSAFVLFMADHLFNDGIVNELVSLSKRSDQKNNVVLAVDKDLENPLVDLEDVTKVNAVNGKITDIGKELTHYNCFDTGFFLCSPTIFPALEASSSLHADTSLSGAMRVLSTTGNALIQDVSGSFWIDIDDPTAYEKAEKYLIKLRDKR